MSPRLIVCVGSGGAGKTTVAAALATAAARDGARCLVITLDPARRLADVLGVAVLDDSEREVAETHWRRSGGAGRLTAVMLEAGPSFDAMIRRHAESDEQSDAVLDNPVYRSFSRALARSHALVALDRVHALLSRRDLDLIVIDTPPSLGAVEMFDGPTRLAELVADPIVGWLTREPTTGALSRLVQQGSAAMAPRVLALLSSRRLTAELAQFLRLMTSFAPGLGLRAVEVTAVLRREARWVLVTVPERGATREALGLASLLAERGHRVRDIVLNRCAPGVERLSARDARRALAVSEGTRESELLGSLLDLVLQRETEGPKTDHCETTLLREIPGASEVIRLPQMSAGLPAEDLLDDLARRLSLRADGGLARGR